MLEQLLALLMPARESPWVQGSTSALEHHLQLLQTLIHMEPLKWPELLPQFIRQLRVPCMAPKFSLQDFRLFQQILNASNAQELATIRARDTAPTRDARCARDSTELICPLWSFPRQLQVQALSLFETSEGSENISLFLRLSWWRGKLAEKSWVL